MSGRHSAEENTRARKRLRSSPSLATTAQDDSALDAGASFIPHQKLREHISAITPLTFSDLAAKPEDMFALFHGTSEISVTDSCEEHELELPIATGSTPRKVYLRFQSGKTRDVLTRDDAVIANSPQRIFQAHQKEPSGRVFFTYMLSSCGTSERRLCFTLAQRAFSFEAATKHQHLFFLRMHSKVYCAGELAVYGAPAGRPMLVVINRMSGTVMRPLEKNNDAVNFDAVVALAASQFFGRAWTVLQAPDASVGRFTGENWTQDLPALRRAAREGRLQRPLVIVGKTLPVFNVPDDPEFAPLTDATRSMSVRALARRFPNASMWTTCTALHETLELMARLSQFQATLAELQLFADRQEKEGAPEKNKKITLQKIRLKENIIRQTQQAMDKHHSAEEVRLSGILGFPVVYDSTFTLKEYVSLLLGR